MRHKLKPEDQPHLLVRSLCIDYAAGVTEQTHTHNWPQFLYARRGVIRAYVNGVLWFVPPRNGLWLPAHTPHNLQMLGAVQLRTLYFAPALAQATLPPGVLKVSGLLHEGLLRTCDLHTLDTRKTQHGNIAAVLIDEIKAAGRMALNLQMPVDKRAVKLTAYFVDSKAAFWPLPSLYAKAGLSRRTAERLFLKETGLPPARWRRMAMLSSGLSARANGARMEDAALLAGYKNCSTFCTAFSKTFGFTPGRV